MKLLHILDHGLGDCVQFTAVLSHLAYFKPTWENHVATGVGKMSAFANAHLVGTKGQWDRTITHDWPEGHCTYADSPATKAVRCIRESLAMSPQWDLLQYHLDVGEEACNLACKYVASLPESKGVVLIHYQGNTSSGNKDMSHDDARTVCNWLSTHGFIPIILDWDRRSPLPDDERIFCPAADHWLWRGVGTGDAQTLAALFHQAKAAVVIDSGPGKVAYAVGIPTVSVWTKHHPLHYADNTPEAVHLVPHNHRDFIRGDKDVGVAFFESHYRHVVYSDLRSAIVGQLGQILGVGGNNPMPDSSILTATSYDVAYYEQHKLAGLDYIGHGWWQRNYGTWLIESLDLKGKRLLDVGCAAGSIAKGLTEAGAVVDGVDLNEHMIRLGRKRWLADHLKVCDAVNLHYWRNNTFDAIHTNNVAEHWKPALVPHILDELHRVTRPGGILFCVLDTAELYERQKRDMAKEDATHICVKPMAWWLEQLLLAGWKIDENLEKKVKSHPLSYFQTYDWPCMIATKP